MYKHKCVEYINICVYVCMLIFTYTNLYMYTQSRIIAMNIYTRADMYTHK